jgi:hypothetical protein
MDRYVRTGQVREDFFQELMPMPLPDPGLRPGWNIAKSKEGEDYFYNSGTGQVYCEFIKVYWEVEDYIQENQTQTSEN